MILSVANLHVNYGQSRILNDVALHIEPEQVVCLLGRNGVGKTTLLRTIMGLLRPASGQITFEGGAITTHPAHLRAQAGIGYVPQGRGIFPYLSVEENLLIGLEGARKRVHGSLEEIYTFFPVLKIMARRTAGVLSGGQQQQLAIGRALMSKPRLLLLDEPTEGLAPVIVQQIGRTIARLKTEGFTILLVEQNFRFAATVADRHYVVERGRIIDEIANARLGASMDKLHEYLGV
jgi:urea ABC transporter ATP-binding protein UrtE